MRAPLFDSPDACDAFARTLATRALGKRIVFIEQTQSTNDLALDAARTGGAHGTIFAADGQDAGRGRRGRTWACPPGMGLLFSVLLHPERIPPECAGWIPLVAGLSCVEALAMLSPTLDEVTVKWPNDIVLPSADFPGWKKLGGILCESALPALSTDSARGTYRGYAVIGIGLNINQTLEMLPETGKAPASSARIESGDPVDRLRVFKSIIERLERNLDTLSDAAGRAGVQSALEEHLRAWLPPAKMLTFHSPPAENQNAVPRHGTFRGLDSFGRIRIAGESGEAAYADAEIIAVGY